VQKFRFVAEDKKITLQAKVGEHLPLAFADIGLVERVFDNLIENALRYTPAEGSIVIAVSAHLERLQITVSDTGSGLSPEELSSLFDRSYQLERGRRKEASGSGLGLAITRRIVELHGSGIEVQSETGAGTTFRFTLPVSR
jgi:two-component system, OmpR family, sensor kinase